MYSVYISLDKKSLIQPGADRPDLCTCSVDDPPLLSFSQLLFLLLLLGCWAGSRHFTVGCQRLQQQQLVKQLFSFNLMTLVSGSLSFQTLNCEALKLILKVLQKMYLPQQSQQVYGSPWGPPGFPWPTQTGCTSSQSPGLLPSALPALTRSAALSQQSY